MVGEHTWCDASAGNVYICISEDTHKNYSFAWNK